MLAAHLHLALAHIPVLFIPLGIALLAWGVYAKAPVIKQVALVVTVLGGLAAVPVFISGEEAEDTIERVYADSENYIEEHEEVAEVAFPLTLLTGGLALLALLFGKMGLSYERYVIHVAMVAGVIATLFLLKTANLGGQIGHKEIRSSYVEGDGGLMQKSFDKHSHEDDHDDDDD